MYSSAAFSFWKHANRLWGSMEDQRANLSGITRANIINTTHACHSFILVKMISISPSLSQFLYLFLLASSHFGQLWFFLKDKRNVKKPSRFTGRCDGGMSVWTPGKDGKIVWSKYKCESITVQQDSRDDQIFTWVIIGVTPAIITGKKFSCSCSSQPQMQYSLLSST